MNKYILLVEDEEDLRMTLSDRLQSEGYVVDVAVDGNEGLNKATSRSFVLIVLDIMLPRRSGLDVMSGHSQRRVNDTDLLLTAHDQITDKVVGLGIGSDEYNDQAIPRTGIDGLYRRSDCGVRSRGRPIP